MAALRQEMVAFKAEVRADLARIKTIVEEQDARNRIVMEVVQGHNARFDRMEADITASHRDVPRDHGRGGETSARVAQHTRSAKLRSVEALAPLVSGCALGVVGVGVGNSPSAISL